MSLLSVDEARRRILDPIGRLTSERVALTAAQGRTLAADLIAQRTQPPFTASAMDGYALRSADLQQIGQEFVVIGEAAAGRSFEGLVASGQAVRIFTGAPLPQGADTVVIQENTRKILSDRVAVDELQGAGRHLRPAGLDFHAGDRLLRAGTRLGWQELTLAAAMDHAALVVVRPPRVAIVSTGDELVRPGTSRRPDQIVASNAYGLAAIVASEGGVPFDLGLVGDDEAETVHVLREALDGGADLIVTLGGASVGDHDVVQSALKAAGMKLDFWKIAMRPGKPLMSGRIGDVPVLGLPGNPVSSLVGAVLFVRPLIAAMLGRPTETVPAVTEATLGAPMKSNDSRQDYVRARLEPRENALPVVVPMTMQDSSMLSSLAAADCLLIRPPHAPAADIGEHCIVIRLRD